MTKQPNDLRAMSTHQEPAMTVTRPAEPSDQPAIVALAIAAGLFTAEDSALVDSLMQAYFDLEHALGNICRVAARDGAVVGVVYCRPEPATSGTDQMLMIAVDPAMQGTGIGRSLTADSEAILRDGGSRLLLVQTLGTPDFEATRAFYRACGYAEEARVRDYYADGQDMVLFRKLLRP